MEIGGPPFAPCKGVAIGKVAPGRPGCIGLKTTERTMFGGQCARSIGRVQEAKLLLSLP